MVSIGAVGGINEGEYTGWTWKWTNTPSKFIMGCSYWDMVIDDKNGKLSILYYDGDGDNRFAIYNISNFSAVYESPVGSDYTYKHPASNWKAAIHEGISCFGSGGASRTLQTYLLFLRNDESTIEVRRGGSMALWSRDTATDFGRAVWCDSGGISPTGKYIVVLAQDQTTPYNDYLMLYEGS